MKKIVITILAIFYLGVSSGATVRVHLCMGQLIDWGISHNEGKKCSNCGMDKEKSESCCSDQQFKLTVKDTLRAPSAGFQFNTLEATVPPTAFIELIGINHKNLTSDKLISDSPPRPQATPAFIRNCSFRI